MLSGVGIICFTASYGVALALEVSRMFFRSGVRGAVMVGFAVAGLVAHTAYLYHHAIQAVGAPLSSQRDWCLLAAWLLVASYLYLVWNQPKALVGLFLLPMALGLIAVAMLAASAEPFARGPASYAWGIIHGGAILLAAVTLFVGCATAWMYLWQSRRLKHKQLARLPSLEWLERTNRRAIVLAMPLVGVAVFAGIVLKRINTDPSRGSLPWFDPVILVTLALLVWLVAATVMARFYRPTHTGRKLAWMTIIAFLLMAISLGSMLSRGTQHGGSRTPAGAVEAPAAGGGT